jgi:hypothetical protein
MELAHGSEPGMEGGRPSCTGTGMPSPALAGAADANPDAPALYHMSLRLHCFFVLMQYEHGSTESTGCGPVLDASWNCSLIKKPSHAFFDLRHCSHEWFCRRARKFDMGAAVDAMSSEVAGACIQGL